MPPLGHVPAVHPGQVSISSELSFLLYEVKSQPLSQWVVGWNLALRTGPP